MLRSLIPCAAVLTMVLLAAACSGSKSATPTPATVLVEAPIEEVRIEILESFPVRYVAAITSGLPNACHEFGDARLNRAGSQIEIRVTNVRPSDPNVACAEIYRTIESRVDLGTEFTSGETYVVDVNETRTSFVAQ